MSLKDARKTIETLAHATADIAASYKDPELVAHYNGMSEAFTAALGLLSNMPDCECDSCDYHNQRNGE